MTQPPQQLMAPTTGDAPTLTLAACVLMASEFPKAFTPDEQRALGVRAVDAVMAVWNEMQTRIATPPVIVTQPS